MARVDKNKGFHISVSGKCIDCHTEHKGEDYNIMPIDEHKFDHALTGFPLEDKHKISCSKCHNKEKTFLGLSKECLGCHTDVHQKTLPECLTCHSFKGWKGLQFNHDRYSKFKLTGKHAEVKCENCHPEQILERKNIKADKVYKVLKFKPLNHESCDSCHKSIHKGDMKVKDCSACHSTQDWKEQTFDHGNFRMSDFKLEGSHAKVSCELCHPEEKTIVKTNGNHVEKYVKRLKPIKHALCNDCHFDVHKGQFKDRKCDSCHTVQEKWKNFTFKHESKEYKGFKLEGRHKEVSCEKCHQKSETAFKEFNKNKAATAGKFKPLESDKCSDCHNDFHNDLKDKACESCHSTKGWKEQTFDHGNPGMSDFKLEGSHAKASCDLCHPEEKTIVKIDGKQVEKSIRKLKPIKHALCNDCHFDVHNGDFKDKKCDSCHTVQENWKNITFKHESKEYKGFKLEGRHKEVSCEKCHQMNETLFKEFNKNKTAAIGKLKPIKYDKCSDCHVDVHQEQFKDRQCDSCHTVLDQWKNVTFKHESKEYNGFKLEGKHVNVTCEKCHARSEIKFTEFGDQKQISLAQFKPVEYMTCISCHEDKHNGKFEKACEKCHMPDGWEPRNFLHDPMTSELKGVHNTLSCVECHKQSKNFKGLDSSCTSCHKDAHLNQFGRFCGDCHRQQSWIPPDFKHTGVGFRLAGGHRQADCKDCHKNNNYRNTPTDCYVCHQSDYQSAPNHVTSMYSHDCTECHKTSGTWQQVSHDHISFTFQGAHAALKGDCAKCHLSFSVILSFSAIPSGTTDNDCYNCHATAGVATTKYEGVTSPSHVTNNFSRTCTDCHTNTAWTPARYTHRIFQLSGAHSALTCTGCHTNGYPGSMSGIASDDCNACHSSDYQSAPNHVSANYPRTCSSCHSTSTWAGAEVHQTFQFLYRHGTLSCTSCHQSGYPGQYAGASETDCYACHANDYREEHTTCSHTCTLCHNGNNWSNPRSKNGCN